MANSLDFFVPGIESNDTKKRLETGYDLINYLKSPNASLACENFEHLIDSISVCINCSIFKVSLMGLEVIEGFINRMKSQFKPYVNNVLPATIDRLGDNKDQVREGAKRVMYLLMEPASSPAYVVERMGGALGHKSSRVKEEALMLLQGILDRWGGKSFSLSKNIPTVLLLFNDSNSNVREQAMLTLVELYKHGGEKVRMEVAKKDAKSSKMTSLLAKMDEVRDSGMVKESKSDTMVKQGFRRQSSFKSKQSTSASSITQVSSSFSSSSSLPANQDTFRASFLTVPTLYISSEKDLKEKMASIKDSLCDKDADWEKRQNALKEMRALVIGGALKYQECLLLFKGCSTALETSLNDLRSQVVREACITISFLSQELGRSFESIAQLLTPPLILLLANSIKIMSTSAFTTLKFIVQHTPYPKFITLVSSNINNSKAVFIRRQCCELVELLTRVWPLQMLDKQATSLADVIKKGINDSDRDAKAHSRKAYWNFEENFPTQARQIFNSLDMTQKKHLSDSQQPVSTSTSTSSLPSSRPSSMASARSTSKERSHNRGRSQDKAPRKTITSKKLTEAAAEPRNTTHKSRYSSASTRGRRSASSGRSGGGITMPGRNTTIAPSSSTTNLSKIPKSSINFNTTIHNPLNTTIYNPLNTTFHNPLNTTFHNTINTTTKNSFNKSSNNKLNNTISYSKNKATSNIKYTPKMPNASPRFRSTSSSPSSRAVSPSHIPLFKPLKTPQLPDNYFKNTDTSHHFTMPGRITKSNDKGSGAPPQSRIPPRGSISRPPPQEAIPSEAVSEVISRLTSSLATDRMASLQHLKQMFLDGKKLDNSDLHSAKNALGRLMFDNNENVVNNLLSTLPSFISLHKHLLDTWMPSCVPVLLKRLSTSSGNSEVRDALVLFRVNSCPELQFKALCNEVVYNMHDVSSVEKLTMLGYLLDLLNSMMVPQDLSDLANQGLFITRIITWSTDHLCSRVRKASKLVLLQLRHLNPQQLQACLSKVPSTFQETADKVLQWRRLSEDSSRADVLNNNFNYINNRSNNTFDNLSSDLDSVSNSSLETGNINSAMAAGSNDGEYHSDKADLENINPLQYDSRNYALDDVKNNNCTDKSSHGSPLNSHKNNTSDRGDYVRKSIDNESMCFNETFKDNIFKESDSVLCNYNDLGDLLFNHNDNMLNGDPFHTAQHDNFNTAQHDPFHNTQHDNFHTPPNHPPSHNDDLFKPDTYIENHINTNDIIDVNNHHNGDCILEMDRVEEGCYRGEGDESKHANKSDEAFYTADEIDKIIQILADKKEGTVSKLKMAQLQLVAADEDNTEVWMYHFKTILLLLIDYLAHPDDELREMAMKVIVELARHHPHRLLEHIQIVFTKVADISFDLNDKKAHKGHDTCMDLIKVLPSNESSLPLISAIQPYLSHQQSHVRSLAFRYQYLVVHKIHDASLMHSILPSIVPSLIKGFSDKESKVRKESVYSLVEIHYLAPNQLAHWLMPLNKYQKKLLNLYIKKKENSLLR